MGKLTQGILGGVSGSVGNVVGSSWKGIPVIKAKPLSVANPRTAGQVAQRSKMTNVVAFAGEILSSVIKPLWDRFAQRQSGYNAFIAENIGLFDSESPSPAGDLVISKGKMAPTPITISSYVFGDVGLDVNWLDDSGEGLKLASDEAYIVAVNVTKNKVAADAANAVRSDGSVGGLFNDLGWENTDTIEVYLAFRRADGTVVSDTAHHQATPA